MIETHRSGDEPSVWVLADDRTGNVSQCIGVAEAVGLPFTRKDLAYSRLGRLPNVMLRTSLAGLDGASRARLTPPWPNMVISAGRRTAPIARHIKRCSGGRTLLIQIMNPGECGVDDFDLIVAPRHDGLPERPNLLQITGAPHRVTAERLREEAKKWETRLGNLPRPRVAVIIGGSTHKRQFTPKMARDLGRTVSAMMRDVGGSLLISTSRRTGKAAEDMLGEIGVPSQVFRWGDDGENPYFGYLALSDGIVVTGESVSMCSEACATPAPVFVFAPMGLVSPKHVLFHHDLYDQGYARPLTGTFERWSHPPLNPADDIAAEIKRRFGLTG